MREEENMNHIYICRRCGDRRLPPPHDWAGERDRFLGATEPHPGGLGWCGDLHDWIPAEDTMQGDTMRSGYTRCGSGRDTMYRRVIRASRWDPACGVRWPGSWEATIERAGRGWRYVVGHYGRDEYRLAKGQAPTLREAMEAADAALASVADEIQATRAAERWIAGAGNVDELLGTPGALRAAGY